MILFNAVIGILAAMQYFTQAFVMGGGDTGDTSMGIGNSLQFAVVYLYEVAFEDLRVGYASAMGWVLFLIMLIFIAILLKVSDQVGPLRRMEATMMRGSARRAMPKRRHISCWEGLSVLILMPFAWMLISSRQDQPAVVHYPHQVVGVASTSR